MTAPDAGYGSPLDDHIRAIRSVVRLSDLIGIDECRRLAEQDRKVERAARRAAILIRRRRQVRPSASDRQASS